MCYSAQIERDWRKYLRVMGTEGTLNEDFIKKYWWRQNEFPSMKIPKAVDAWFANPQNGDEQKIAAFVEAFNDQEVAKLERLLFQQKKRRADAERSLQTKQTKKAIADQRNSSDKSEGALGKLGDIRRQEFKSRDARIFPGWFAPVIVSAGSDAATIHAIGAWKACRMAERYTHAASISDAMERLGNQLVGHRRTSPKLHRRARRVA
jgi:hypothetical protein